MNVETLLLMIRDERAKSDHTRIRNDNNLYAIQHAIVENLERLCDRENRGPHFEVEVSDGDPFAVLVKCQDYREKQIVATFSDGITAEKGTPYVFANLFPAIDNEKAGFAKVEVSDFGQLDDFFRAIAPCLAEWL